MFETQMVEQSVLGKNLARMISFKQKFSILKVFFFDEIDSLAPARGESGDSAMVMDRIVASLLSELDDLPREVFVLAATNRPDLLDAALTRPGRLDRSVYVGPGDPFAVFNALKRNFEFEDEISPQFPQTFTGADIAGVLKSAQMQAKNIKWVAN